MSISLEQSWLNILNNEFEKEYMKSLKTFLRKEKSLGKIVYPKGQDIFNAMNHTPFDKVKIVILGQDPYHGDGQANGLCFSVPKGIAIPPSLRNIYKELSDDIPNFEKPKHGDLTQWADQGVLLLNATLTVRAHEAGSHQGIGWEIFTDTIIRKLSLERENIIFLLWGRFAQNKSILIEPSKHTVFKAAHPSPLSAYNGFLGCRHFSKANEVLERNGQEPINWQIT